jgi:RNA polymerase sigma factor (sigma-70 family)
MMDTPSFDRQARGAMASCPSACETADLLQPFFQQVARSPRLTRHQEQALICRALAGDQQASLLLVEANLRLVIKMARRYCGYGLDLADLIQEGNLGLLLAVQHLDPQRPHRFSTVATLWIRQAIVRALENQGRTIRLPVFIHQRLRRLVQAEHAYVQAHSRLPNAEALAAWMQVPLERIESLLCLQARTLPFSALSVTDEEALADGLPDQQTPDPLTQICAAEGRTEVRAHLHTLLSSLAPQQRAALLLRFGLAGPPAQSYRQIGCTLGISPQRAHQLVKHALAHLRQAPEALALHRLLIEREAS